MVKQPYKFMVSVPDWFGAEFLLHECHFDDLETAAEEFVQEHDDECTVINRSNGIEVLVRRIEDPTVHKFHVIASASIDYSAYEG